MIYPNISSLLVLDLEYSEITIVVDTIKNQDVDYAQLTDFRLPGPSLNIKIFFPVIGIPL